MSNDKYLKGKEKPQLKFFKYLKLGHYYFI